MAYNTVILKGDPLYKEGSVKTGQTITPGMFVKRDSGGVLVAAATDVPAEVAIELGIEGSGIDDDYTAGEQILTASFRKGDEVYAILATSQTIALGAELECANGGLLQANSANTAVARALEAVTTTAATKRIKVEIV
jgi:hypothetical protein